MDTVEGNKIIPVKLTKKALNDFIGWTSSRYNDYMGYGTKKQNVNTVYNSLQKGYYVSDRGTEQPDRKVFTIECASPVGESGPQGRKHHGAYWKTKQAADEYTIDCVAMTITAKYSQRTIQFLNNQNIQDGK